MAEQETKSRRGLLVLVLIAIVLIPPGYSLVSRVIAQEPPPEMFLERAVSMHESCVTETEFMRLHHWEFLKGMREEVVRYGKRGDLNLNKCRECHTSRGQFCNKCHNSVSLEPDCFGCHYYPVTKAEAEAAMIDKPAHQSPTTAGTNIQPRQTR